MSAETQADVDATAEHDNPRVHLVKIRLCELCLQGAGEECHTPACALWLHNSPGMPIHPELYEILQEDA